MEEEIKKYISLNVHCSTESSFEEWKKYSKFTRTS